MGCKRSAAKVLDRPYPWVCPNCLETKVEPRTQSQHVGIRHDGVEYNLFVPNLEVPTCGSCGEELFSNRVDAQIRAALRKHLRLLNPEEIRAERKALGLSQKELANRMGIAHATICRWETGVLIQSGAMDKYLRLFFTLPAVREALGGEKQPASGPGWDDSGSPRLLQSECPGQNS